jgi:membrane protein YdbS with pleckstrin-like domain
MLFNKNDGKPNDRILYQTKPNMLLGCKKAIYGVILLVIIFSVAPFAIRFIGQMQVYLISQIQLSLTRYAAIAFFVVILIDIIYIIWQLVGWHSMEYTLTESKIIIKSGVLSTKRNYMPYATIQDINTSQGLLARLFNVGTVSVFSAYDNNQMELKNISNPSEVEEIIFSRLGSPRNFQPQPQMFPQNQPNYPETEEFYDEYEPITPITHERSQYPRRDYEYYPEDLGYNDAPRHTYEYEPYDNRYDNPSGDQSRTNYYNRVRDDYSNGGEDYYHNNGQDMHYDDGVQEVRQNESKDMDDSSETAIKRHFDKFKR